MSKVTTKEDVQELLGKNDTFIFDCDGVIWLGDHPIPGSVETINLLNKLNKQVIFVTNNSTKSRSEYIHKFEKFGLNVTKEQVFGSAYASATYLNKIIKLDLSKKVWVLGENGIVEELKELGYTVLGGTDPRLNETFNHQTSPFLPIDEDVGAVIVGLDTKINYTRLAITLQYLQNKDIHFLATNIDSTFPQKGLILPGAGSIVESVTYSSGRTPIACGKPSQNMLDAIVADKGFKRDRAIMVGDRLNTDMEFGNNGGLNTLLVLTGIETEENAKKANTIKNYADRLGVISDLFE